MTQTPLPTCPHSLARLLPSLSPSPHLTSHLLSILPSLPDAILNSSSSVTSSSSDFKNIYIEIIENLPYVLLPHAGINGAFTSSSSTSSHSHLQQSQRIIQLALYILQRHLTSNQEWIVPILGVMSQLEAKLHMNLSGGINSLGNRAALTTAHAHNSASLPSSTHHAIATSLQYKVIDYAITALKYCPEQDLPALCKTILRLCASPSADVPLAPTFSNASTNVTSYLRRRAHESPHVVRAVRVMRSELQLVEDINIIRMVICEVLQPVLQVNQPIYMCFQLQLQEVGGSLSEFDVFLLLTLLKVSVFESQSILDIVDKLMDEGALSSSLLCATLEKYREIIDSETISQLAVHLVVHRGGSWSFKMVPYFFREYSEIRPQLMNSLLVSLTEPNCAKRVGLVILKLAQESPQVLETSCTALEESLYEAHHYLSVDVVHCLCATLCILVHLRREHLLRSLIIFIRKQVFSSSERCQSFALICLSHLMNQEYSLDFSRDILQLLQLAVNVSTTQLMDSFGKMPIDMLCRHCFIFDLIIFNWNSALMRKHFEKQIIELYILPLSTRIVLWKRGMEGDGSGEEGNDDPTNADAIEPDPTTIHDHPTDGSLGPNSSALAHPAHRHPPLSFLHPSQHTVNIANNPQNLYFDVQAHYTTNLFQWEFVLNALQGFLRMYLTTTGYSDYLDQLVKCPESTVAPPLNLTTLLSFGFAFPFDVISRESPSQIDLYLFSMLSAYVIGITLCRLSQMRSTFSLSDSVQIHQHVLFCVFLRSKVENIFHLCNEHLYIEQVIFKQHTLNAAVLSSTLSWSYANWTDFSQNCRERYNLHPLLMEEMLLNQLQQVFHRNKQLRFTDKSYRPPTQHFHFYTAEHCVHVADEEMDIKIHEEVMVSHPSTVQHLLRHCLKKAKYMHKVQGDSEKLTLLHSICSSLLSLNFCANTLCELMPEVEKHKFLKRCTKLFFQLDNFGVSFLVLLLVHQLTQDTNHRRVCSILGISLLRRPFNNYSMDPDSCEALLEFLHENVVESSLVSQMASKLDESCNKLWEMIQTTGIEMSTEPYFIQTTTILVILSTEDDDVTFFVEDLLLSMRALTKSKQSWYGQVSHQMWPAYFVPLFFVLNRVLENMPLDLNESAERHGQIIDLLMLLIDLCTFFQTQGDMTLQKSELSTIFEHLQQTLRILEENCELLLSCGKMYDSLRDMMNKVDQFASRLHENFLTLRPRGFHTPLARAFPPKIRAFNSYLSDAFSVFNIEHKKAKSFLTKGGKRILREYFDECIQDVYEILEVLTWERESHEENKYFVLKRVWREVPEEQLFQHDALGEGTMSQALVQEEMRNLVDDQSMSSDDEEFVIFDGGRESRAGDDSVAPANAEAFDRDIDMDDFIVDEVEVQPAEDAHFRTIKQRGVLGDKSALPAWSKPQPTQHHKPKKCVAFCDEMQYSNRNQRHDQPPDWLMEDSDDNSW